MVDLKKNYGGKDEFKQFLNTSMWILCDSTVTRSSNLWIHRWEISVSLSTEERRCCKSQQWTLHINQDRRDFFFCEIEAWKYSKVHQEENQSIT